MEALPHTHTHQQTSLAYDEYQMCANSDFHTILPGKAFFSNLWVHTSYYTTLLAVYGVFPLHQHLSTILAIVATEQLYSYFSINLQLIPPEFTYEFKLFHSNNMLESPTYCVYLCLVKDRNRGYTNEICNAKLQCIGNYWRRTP